MGVSHAKFAFKRRSTVTTVVVETAMQPGMAWGVLSPSKTEVILTVAYPEGAGD